MTTSKPSKTPTQESNISGSGETLLNQSTPTEFSTTEMAMIMAANAVAAPILEPPTAAMGEKGITTWMNDKRINALWSINQDRNSWMGVSGVGWKKLANNSDSAIVALTALASHAKQLNCRIDYREEADGKVHEMYVW